MAWRGRKRERENVNTLVSLLIRTLLLLDQGPTLRTSFNLCCCSAAKSFLTLYGPMDCSTLGSSVLLHPPEFAQIHVH